MSPHEHSYREARHTKHGGVRKDKQEQRWDGCSAPSRHLQLVRLISQSEIDSQAGSELQQTDAWAVTGIVGTSKVGSSTA